MVWRFSIPRIFSDNQKRLKTGFTPNFRFYSKFKFVLLFRLYSFLFLKGKTTKSLQDNNLMFILFIYFFVSKNLSFISWWRYDDVENNLNLMTQKERQKIRKSNWIFFLWEYLSQHNTSHSYQFKFMLNCVLIEFTHRQLCEIIFHGGMRI